jgi:hypothetical protein
MQQEFRGIGGELGQTRRVNSGIDMPATTCLLSGEVCYDVSWSDSNADISC